MTDKEADAMFSQLLKGSEKESLRKLTEISVTLSSLLTVTKQNAALLAAILDAQNLHVAEEKHKKGKK